MPHHDLAEVAALLGAGGSAAILLARSRRNVLFTGFVVLAAAELALAIALVPTHDLRRLKSALLVAGLVAALLAVLALTVLLVRRPDLTAPLLLVAAPFRIPVDLGSQHAFLLIPLYGVLAAAALAFVVRTARDGPPRAIPWILAAPTATFVALSGVSLLWSRDVEHGSIELLFFLFPFAVLVAVVARSPFPRWQPRALAAILVGLTAVFALIGIYQRLTHTLLYAPSLEISNTYTSYFRVSAVFKDPSIYGRYLALGIAVVLVAHWVAGLRLAITSAILALLSVGLWLSYSQSSMAAVFVTAMAITLVAGDRTARRLVAVVGSISILLASALVISHARGESTRAITSDRSRLVDVTWTVIRHHPLVGVGVGAQPKASRDEGAEGSTIPSRNTSHTTPLTVVAELGVLGAAAYLFFIGAAAKLLYVTARRRFALGVSLASVFLVLVIHSLFYAGFFEDPLTWGSLAIAAAALAVAPPPRPPLPGASASLANADDDGWGAGPEVPGIVEPGKPERVPPAR
jgi:succinate dehydrogenase/fumarate reductase cytochrome b subunit